MKKQLVSFSEEEIEELLNRPMIYLADDEDLASVSDAQNNEQDKAFVYVVSSLGLVKIGMTCMLEERIKGLQNMSAAPVALLFTQEFDSYRKAYDAEQAMHKKFVPFRHHGEWFELTEESLQELKAALGAPPATINI